MFTDSPQDEIGESLGLGYLADGVLAGLERLSKGHALDDVDREAFIEAQAFLESASRGPEFLTTSEFSTRSREQAVAFGTAARVVTSLPSALLGNGNGATEWSTVVHTLHELSKACSNVLEADKPAPEDLQVLESFFNSVAKLTFDRVSNLTWERESRGRPPEREAGERPS